MANEERYREIAAAALDELIHAHIEEVAAEIARRVAAEAPNGTASDDPLSASIDTPPAGLIEVRDGALAIAATRTQTETLEALIAAAATVTPGCGLLILRGVQAVGWNSRGLVEGDRFKRVVLDCAHGAAARVVGTVQAAEVSASELDRTFTAALGLQPHARLAILPVLLKERVAALLVTLAPLGRELPALQILLQMAQFVIDLQAYRKGAPKPDAHAPAPAAPAVAHSPAPAPAVHEPEVGAAAVAAAYLPAPAAEAASVAAYSTSPVVQYSPAPVESPDAEHEPAAVEAVEPAAVEVAPHEPENETQVHEASVQETPEPEAAQPHASEHEAPSHEAPTAETPQHPASEPTEYEAPEYAAPEHTEHEAPEHATAEHDAPEYGRPEHAASEPESLKPETPEVEAPAAELAYPPVEVVSVPPFVPSHLTEHALTEGRPSVDAYPAPSVTPYTEPSPEPEPERPAEAAHASPQPESQPEPESVAAPEVAPAQPAAPAPPAYHSAEPIEQLVAQHASNAPKGEDAFYRSALASALEIEPGSARPDEGLAAAAAALRQSAAHVAMAQPTDEAHVKARRFAKLLVDEIKLYYEPRVAEGRAHYDLYQRLREEIDKSRAAYVKRYGETVRDVDYFSQELVRILADNNRAMMGPGFQG